MNLSILTLAFTVPLLAANSVPTNQQPATQLPPSVPVPIPLEIKGDRIGETLDQFKAHYPKSACEERAPNIFDCTQKQGISLAGNTDLGTTCDPPTTDYWRTACDGQGLIAHFETGTLTSLAYRFWINGAKNDVQITTQATCDAFAKKYGQPDSPSGRDGCVWLRKNKDGEIEQTLLITTVNVKIGEKFAVFTMVSLANGLQSKDI